MGARGSYAIVTAGYWAFTLSDGALRMLVLLHLHAVGRSPLEVLAALLPYEIAGVVTNLLGGFLGARFGLKPTLLIGLALQVATCALLASSAAAANLALVMGCQLASGVAKDLTKTGAKSYVKLLRPAGDHGGLFRLVALLTGSKNALKGLGFFVGGALLAGVGFRGALLALGSVLALAALPVLALPRAAGVTQRKVTLTAVFAHEAWLNWLAAARLFLFGSREAWFAIALPLYLTTAAGWSQAGVGAFLALWVVGYGVVQALAPSVVRPRGFAQAGKLVAAWTAALLVPLLVPLALLGAGGAPVPVLTVSLLVYGVLFAVDSSLHSFVVVARGGESVALQVGFYYAANAVGRVVGLVASALLYAAMGEGRLGLLACLAASALAVLVAAACSLPLRRGADVSGRA